MSVLVSCTHVSTRCRTCARWRKRTHVKVTLTVVSVKLRGPSWSSRKSTLAKSWMYFIFVAADVSTSAVVVAMPANMVVRKKVVVEQTETGYLGC